MALPRSVRRTLHLGLELEVWLLFLHRGNRAHRKPLQLLEDQKVKRVKAAWSSRDGMLNNPTWEGCQVDATLNNHLKCLNTDPYIRPAQLQLPCREVGVQTGLIKSPPHSGEGAQPAECRVWGPSRNSHHNVICRAHSQLFRGGYVTLQSPRSH